MGWIKRLKKYGELVMFSHTVFSLPFAVYSMFLAADGIPKASIFVWIFVALFGARNGANAFNRIADREYDAKNPRTAQRHMPKGTVSLKEAYGVVCFCFLVMAVAAYMLNILCLILLPFAIFIFVFYSYSKRFTWLCHIILGIACGGAPVGAWIAVTGSIDLVPIMLAATVTFWIAGFDIIYALQDIAFDRKEKLNSIPARFGDKSARMIAAFFHVCAVGLIIATSFLVGASFLYYIGTVIIAALLFAEHKQILPNDINKMKIASYSINQVVAIVYLVFMTLDFMLL